MTASASQSALGDASTGQSPQRVTERVRDHNTEGAGLGKRKRCGSRGNLPLASNLPTAQARYARHRLRMRGARCACVWVVSFLGAAHWLSRAERGQRGDDSYWVGARRWSQGLIYILHLLLHPVFPGSWRTSLSIWACLFPGRRNPTIRNPADHSLSLSLPFLVLCLVVRFRPP